MMKSALDVYIYILMTPLNYFMKILIGMIKDLVEQGHKDLPYIQGKDDLITSLKCC